MLEDTKYLFNEEKQSLEDTVSVSQLQTFMSCQWKWKYNYIDKIKPRVDKTYLTIGKLCHKGMQVAMQQMWKDQRSGVYQEYLTNGQWIAWMQEGVKAMKEEYSQYMVETPLLDEEIPDMEQLWLDAESVFKQAFAEFEPWKYEVVTVIKDGVEQPALELHFLVPCKPTMGMHGFIDAILKDTTTGSTWCTDYKFRRSLSPDEEEAYNIQNAVYSYACRMMGITITGTMTWQHCNTPATDPQILKSGEISRSKIKTTWEHYKNFCKEHGVDWQNYTEMEEKLSDIEWFRATYEYRNDETIQNIWDLCVIPIAIQVKSARRSIAWHYRSMYPWNCKMCQYQSLCQAELRNYDTQAIIEREYVRR